MEEGNKEYEPLWKQIEKSFKLRDFKNVETATRELTKPKSPTFRTD